MVKPSSLMMLNFQQHATLFEMETNVCVNFKCNLMSVNKLHVIHVEPEKGNDTIEVAACI